MRPPQILTVDEQGSFGKSEPPLCSIDERLTVALETALETET